MKIATVIREKEENSFQTQHWKKNSNIFGSLKNNFSEHIQVGYDFAIDNKLNNIE